SWTKSSTWARSLMCYSLRFRVYLRGHPQESTSRTPAPARECDGIVPAASPRSRRRAIPITLVFVGFQEGASWLSSFHGRGAPPSSIVHDQRARTGNSGY